MNENLKKPYVPPRVAGINAAIAASPLAAQGISQAPSAIPTTITSENLKNTPAINLPTIDQPSTLSSAISAGAESKLTLAKTEADKLQQDFYTRAKDEASVNKSKAEEYLGLGTKSLEERINAMQTPDFLEKKAASDKAYKDIQSSRAAQMAEIKALDSQPITLADKAQRTNDINNKYAYINAQQSLTYDIANKDYTSAKQSIDDLAQLKTEAYAPYISYYSQLASNSQGIFNKAELDILNNKRDEYKTLQTQETQNIKDNGEAMIKYNSLGAGITTNDTAEQRAQKIASVGGELGYEIAKKGPKGTEAPTIKSINGVDMQWNPGTGKWETITATGAGGTLPQAQAQGNIDSITTLLSDKNIRSAVGPTWLGRFVGKGFDSATGGRQNFIAGVEQLTSQLSLDSLIQAKAKGATFGALSEGELRLLSNSATKLSKWAITDDNGKVKGYSASEKDFKAELDKINNYAKLDYILKGGIPEDIGAVLMTDGNYYSINSDGSKQQLTNY